MKKSLLLLLLTFCFTLPTKKTFSQKEFHKPYKNAITFNITKLAVLEARFGYERFLSKRHMARVSLGIQFPVSSTSFSNVLLFIPYYYSVSQGIYLGVGYNYFFGKNQLAYVSGELYYSYSFYDKKYYKSCSGSSSDSNIALQSMDLNKAGVKFLIGRKLSMAPNKETRLQFDFFAGIGIQYRDETITTYKTKQGECSIEGQYSWYVYDPPKISISSQWYPTLHAGILLSLPF